MVERADFVGRIGAYLVRSSNSILGNLAFTSLSNKLPVRPIAEGSNLPQSAKPQGRLPGRERRRRDEVEEQA